MSRQQLAWFFVVALLTLLVMVSAPAFPMTQDAAAEAAEQMGGEESAAAAVERILQQQERMLEGSGFSYESSGRRDPFRSLFEARSIAEARPQGVAGMSVDEIDLAGIVRDTQGGDLALIMGSDNKGYFLRVGDSCYDGELISVDTRLGSVTFRQQVEDPKFIKPYRDVVKRLVPLEESSDE